MVAPARRSERPEPSRPAPHPTQDAAPPGATPPDERWVGYIDEVSGRTVTGWCCDRANPDDSVCVEAVAASGRRSVVLAGRYRADVEAAGFGNGRHGFVLDLAAFEAADGPVSLRFADGLAPIGARPVTLDPEQALLADPLPPAFLEAMRARAAELRRIHAAMRDAEARAALERAAVTTSGGLGERSAGDVAALFATHCPARDLEGLVTRFVAFEHLRLRRDRGADDLAGTLAERLGVLMWYLADYARDRRAGLAVPLSGRQAAFLNGPAPLAGAAPAVTVALLNMVAREKPTHLDLLDPAVLREAVYWWCVERAPQGCFADRLVTADQVALLRAEEGRGDAHPINAFTAQYFTRHPELHALDLGLARDRAAYLHYLVLTAFTRPDLLRFLPANAVRQMLRRRLDGTPAFDRVVSRLALTGEAAVTEGGELRAMGLEMLRRGGWAEPGNSGGTRTAGDTGRCFAGVRDLAGPVENGVALIGPLAQQSGLGQATRLSLAVLERVEACRPTAIPFDLDNPAPTAPAPDFAPYRNRRAINLIHLNAESVPLAFAFEDREVFAASYNIGYVFWELDVLPKCHALALDLLDEIWVSSEYVRAIYARATAKPVVNVGLPAEPAGAPPRPADRGAFGLERDSFTFLATFDAFSFVERKNPLGVVEAFGAAFPDGRERVQLALKTHNRSRVDDPRQRATWARVDAAARRDGRVVILDETLERDELTALAAACDCYVSLHRSEGWGFGMVEAMRLGLPVIATGYSGNLEFCRDDTAFLVDYALTAPREDEYIFVERGSAWAEPCRASAAARMRAVVTDPDAARAKVAAATALIDGRFSLQAIGARYAARLADIRRRTAWPGAARG